MTEPANENEPTKLDEMREAMAKRDRHLTTNARQFERELIAAKLEAELFNESQGDEVERAYRRGWNERARSVIAQLRNQEGER